MGKKSAPEYAKTTTDTGLWGSSTTSKKGTTYNPTSWQQNTMQTVGQNLNPTLQNMLSNDYSNDANFQAYQNQLYNTMNQQYDQMLGNLADRGLMRSSGLDALNNSYAKALQDNVTSLYDNYYNRQANNLSNLMNTSNTLYNYMTGTTNASNNQSNAVSQYNLNKWKEEQAAQQAMFNSLMNAGSQIAGAALTGGTNMLAAQALGNAGNGLKLAGGLGLA